MAQRVMHLARVLKSRPIVETVSGVSLRTFGPDRDIDAWLKLRRLAFEHEQLPVRDWDRTNFQAEFRAKPWWSPERLWFAETTPADGDEQEVIGAITLAMREAAQKGRACDSGAVALPVVHWLMVLPQWRRQGIGRLLLATLEAACWDAGHRRVGLETHVAWPAAVKFYKSMGYEPDCLATDEPSHR